MVSGEPDEYLNKLRDLRKGCEELHDVLWHTLLISGVCKRYDRSSRKGSLRSTRMDSSSTDARRLLSPMAEDTTAPRTLPSVQRRQASRVRERSLASGERQHNTSTGDSNAEETVWDRLSTSKGPVIPPRTRQPVRRPTSGRARPPTTRNARTGRPVSRAVTSSRGVRRRPWPTSAPVRRSKPTKWTPKATVPEPFNFQMIEPRRQSRKTYARKFLEKMLKEKEEREQKELEELNFRFHANPVPRTTYVPDTEGLYIGTLRRSKSATMARRKSDTTKASRRSFASNHKHDSAGKQVPKFHAHPVPITTYVPPDTTFEDLREHRRLQRAIDLMLLSKEPFGMEEHSIRWRVQQRIRHVPRCFPPSVSRRTRSTSVPDFRRLHHEWEERLERVYRPITVTEPFHFSEDYPRHHCENWTLATEDMVLRQRRRRRSKSIPGDEEDA